MSKPQHYSGPELGALLAQVRNELGEDATIHEANKVRIGGVGGFFAKESFEITASEIVSLPEDSQPASVDDGPTNREGLHSEQNKPAWPIADQAESDPLEPSSEIGDLASSREIPGTQIAPRPRISPIKGRELSPPPARHGGQSADQTANQTANQTAITFNFDRLGPSSIPSRLQSSNPSSSRDPVPTPGPLRSGLHASGGPSTSVGELVADALMERAELVNALEHLESTEQMVNEYHREEHRLDPRNAGLGDSRSLDPGLLEPGSIPGGDTQSFDEILDRNLSDPYLDEAYNDPGLGATSDETSLAQTTAEAVAERITAQNHETELVEGATKSEQTKSEQTKSEQTKSEQTKSEQTKSEQIETQEIIEPAGPRERPDFWTRLALAQEEVSLYQPPGSNVTAILGPLELSLPIARRCQKEEWIGVEDLAVLSARPAIPGVPSWQTVAKVNDLHWVMNEWRATQRRGLVVVDTGTLEEATLGQLIVELRTNGAELVRIVLPPGVPIETFVRMALRLDHSVSETIPGHLAVDLPEGTSPQDVLVVLDLGIAIGSIAGSPLSAEMLVALRSEVSGP